MIFSDRLKVVLALCLTNSLFLVSQVQSAEKPKTEKNETAAQQNGNSQSKLNPNIHRRSDFKNSRIQFELNNKGNVAFFGGSITEMNGYRPMVCSFLEKRFPNTQFDFTAAGISSTCSTSGAFRLEEHVLKKGPVDLFFIEYAVNDDQDAGHARRECIRGMEGVIRHTRTHNPNADIVITYFVNPGMLDLIQKGKTPVSIAAHETVAKHYGITTIYLAKEVADQITAGKLTWEKYGGTHPKPFGNAICAGMISELLTDAWKKPLEENSEPTAFTFPKKPIDENHYGKGRFLDIKIAKDLSGWKRHVPAWKELKGGKRSRFTSIPMLCTTEADAELSLNFAGKAIGAYIVAGPDAGIVLASIDGGEFKPIDTFHRFSRGLHYPRTVMFDADLSPGKHKLRLKMSGKKNATSVGHAMRIMQFVVNAN